jgi:predicted CopG family antitoxin
MAKNIALADDVYRQLKRLKRGNESFSELIRRLLRTRANISDLAGSTTLSPEEWIELMEMQNRQDSLDRERGRSLLSKNEEG